jgi:hypothetical protein
MQAQAAAVLDATIRNAAVVTPEVVSMIAANPVASLRLSAKLSASDPEVDKQEMGPQAQKLAG